MLKEDELNRVLAALRRAREQEWPRLNQIRRYIRNDATGDIYVPDEATDEYRMLVDQARFNITPLFVDSLSQNLKVVGYRPTADSGRVSAENSAIWDRAWQPNRLDARQAAAHRAAVKYGVGYTTVLPGNVGGRSVPKIKPWSPLWLTALYDDPLNDEWPRYAMTVSSSEALAGREVTRHVTEVMGPAKVRIYDASHVYTLEVNQVTGVTKWLAADEHGLEVCPVIRFPDEIDDELPRGKVEPQLPIQRQVNQTTFSLLMTQQFQSFRQRWATGMAIETDPETGQPREPFNAAVNSVWQNESPDGRFGDFAETDLTGYLKSRDAALLFAAFTGQVPAHALMLAGGIANINAETLVALEANHRHDIANHKTTFGESWEQTFRLAGKALTVPEVADDDDRQLGEDTWGDTSAQVVWGDTTPRSLAEVADALGKLATMLQIPVEALWEKIPETTDQDLSRWKEMRDQANILAELRGMLDDEPEQEVDPAGVASNGSAPPAA